MSTTVLSHPIVTQRFDAETVHILSNGALIGLVVALPEGGHGLYRSTEKRLTGETFETVKGAVDYFRDMVG